MDKEENLFLLTNYNRTSANSTILSLEVYLYFFPEDTNMNRLT